MTVAALFVETGGVYYGLEGVECWDINRNAMLYDGPHPVVAHPPCQRWGRYARGGVRPEQQNRFKVGDDGGCFKSALEAVRKWGGVLEHPAESLAWGYFGIMPPWRHCGWKRADGHGGWTCYVEQGHYGHFSRKGTWLYTCKIQRPNLRWGKCEQRIHPVALERYGYEKARRIGVMAMVGGKDRTKIRNATPIEFRDLLLDMARSVNTQKDLFS